MSGVFTSEEAHRAGFSKADVRRRLRNGDWVTLRHGVYVERTELAAAPDSRKHALHIAGLLTVLHCDAVASQTSAAQIWGLETIGMWPDELTLATTPTTTYKHRDGYVLRPARLLDQHRVLRYGVPVTSAARTVVDLARTLPSSLNAVVVADSALRKRLVSPERLREVLTESRGWRGVRRATQILELVDPYAESALESVSRVAMHWHGLPAPRTQVVIGAFRVDFLWEQYGVIGEADGIGKYVADGWRTTADIVRAEKRREERLFDLGYEVVRWGWDEAMASDHLAQRLRAAFRRGLERQRGRRPWAA